MVGATSASCSFSAPAGYFSTRAWRCSRSESGFLALLGYQLVLFALFTKFFAIRVGFPPPHPVLQTMFRYITLEVGLVAGVLLALAGLVTLIVAVASWSAVGFGNLNPDTTMREVIPAVVLTALGTQTVFAAFFMSILGIE